MFATQFIVQYKLVNYTHHTKILNTNIVKNIFCISKYHCFMTPIEQQGQGHYPICCFFFVFIRFCSFRIWKSKPSKENYLECSE